MPKSLFEYTDYRAFLREYYESARTKNRKFSFRFFSRIAGFKSSGSILKIMNGTTNLSDEGIGRISLALKFNREETFFFKNLVHFNQAPSATKRQYFAEQLLKCRTYRKIKQLGVTQFKFFSQWYYSPIREMVGLPDFREDPDWIVRHLSFPVSAGEVKEALENLQTLGLLVRDSSGRLMPAERHITSGDEVTFSSAAQCHRQFLEKASESIDLVPREKRDISAMTVGITAETATQLKAMIQEFRKHVVELVAKDSGSELIYQLNMQLFPLTREPKR